MEGTERHSSTGQAVIFTDGNDNKPKGSRLSTPHSDPALTEPFGTPRTKLPTRSSPRSNASFSVPLGTPVDSTTVPKKKIIKLPIKDLSRDLSSPTIVEAAAEKSDMESNRGDEEQTHQQPADFRKELEKLQVSTIYSLVEEVKYRRA